MATKAALPNTEDGLRASATVYFGIVSFLSFCCLLVHVILLPRLAIVKFYREKAQHASSSTTLQKQGSTLSSHRGFTREEEDEMEPITKASTGGSEELGDCFHASDLAGKVVPLRWAGGLRRSQNILLVLAGTRIIFWPLFLVTLAADGAVYMMAVLTAFLGLSNGFITALAMTMGHNHIPPQVRVAAAAAGNSVLFAAFLGFGNGFITALALTMGHNHIRPSSGHDEPNAELRWNSIRMVPGVLATKHKAAGDVELAENILVLFMVAGLNVGALASFVWLLPWPSWLGLPTPASGST
eukprot:gene1767-33182_t